ncbi:haloacid dehalogenase [Azorhizobium oxalatiphilum]|uniref:Haloacid dehalogenase n=1 Tax=Azorhizobium oxalatiphilum TaxID=980631 RepID=A0A917BYG6_9HYPH|nr:HAD-IA family hydrolase [Azorhizobium oxalatiphilum]GGF63337.1 haloacid dehalogenase [Azorhizobium oxalatiphilum]
MPPAAPEPILALFDCDGTLVDSQHMIVAAMEATYRGQGLVPPTRERTLSIVGLSLREVFLVLGADSPDFPPPELMVEAYKEAFNTMHARKPETEPMFPHVMETLIALRGRDEFLLGMATGKARRGVDRLLKAYAMEGWFAAIQTADIAPSKPHPGMVLQAMAEAGTEPARTVMIGDTTYDMEMAKAAGAHAIGVSWGYHPVDSLITAGADRIVTDFRDIPDVIAALVMAAADA